MQISGTYDLNTPQYYLSIIILIIITIIVIIFNTYSVRQRQVLLKHVLDTVVKSSRKVESNI